MNYWLLYGALNLQELNQLKLKLLNKKPITNRRGRSFEKSAKLRVLIKDKI